MFSAPVLASTSITPKITRWESICETHLIGLDFQEEMDIFEGEGGMRAIEKEYVFECSRVIWQKTFSLAQIRRIQAYGHRLRLVDPSNAKLEVYEFIEELWPKPQSTYGGKL
jgi:hypothetical protein